ncbi:MAG: hypothetical protein LUE96_11095 [Lachnospiraceae bacterium]|nr:hypothetical protein [Lachnospiraceae bacterium]
MTGQKPKKGEYRYPEYERKRVIIRTFIYFAASLAVFLLGYISTGTRENLLTIVAVLGLLPSSKSLVSVIMYLRIPKFSPGIYDEIAKHAGTVRVLYSMYLTSYKLNFPINCFAVRGGNLIGFTEFASCDADACEKHIRDILNQNSINGVTLKIFRERHRFTDRLLQLEALEADGKEKEILTLLGEISL